MEEQIYDHSEGSKRSEYLEMASKIKETIMQPHNKTINGYIVKNNYNISSPAASSAVQSNIFDSNKFNNFLVPQNMNDVSKLVSKCSGKSEDDFDKKHLIVQVEKENGSDTAAGRNGERTDKYICVRFPNELNTCLPEKGNHKNNVDEIYKNCSKDTDKMTHDSINNSKLALTIENVYYASSVEITAKNAVFNEFTRIEESSSDFEDHQKSDKILRDNTENTEENKSLISRDDICIQTDHLNFGLVEENGSNKTSFVPESISLQQINHRANLDIEMVHEQIDDVKSLIHSEKSVSIDSEKEVALELQSEEKSVKYTEYILRTDNENSLGHETLNEVCESNSDETEVGEVDYNVATENNTIQNQLQKINSQSFRNVEKQNLSKILQQVGTIEGVSSVPKEGLKISQEKRKQSIFQVQKSMSKSKIKTVTSIKTENSSGSNLKTLQEEGFRNSEISAEELVQKAKEKCPCDFCNAYESEEEQLEPSKVTENINYNNIALAQSVSVKQEIIQDDYQDMGHSMDVPDSSEWNNTRYDDSEEVPDAYSSVEMLLQNPQIKLEVLDRPENVYPYNIVQETNAYKTVPRGIYTPNINLNLNQEEENSDDIVSLIHEHMSSLIVSNNPVPPDFPHVRMVKYKCPFCIREFSAKKTMIIHKYSHLGGMPFACSICKKGFILEKNYQMHLSTKHKKFVQNRSQIMSCSICSEKCLTESHLKDHIRLNHKFVQETSNENKAYGPDNKKLKTTEKAESKLNISQITSTIKPNINPKRVCTICNKVFKNRVLCHKHKKKVHSSKKTGGKKELFNCKECSRCYLSLSHLERHFETRRHKANKVNSMNSNVEKNSCNVCGKVFQSQENLTKHKILHQNGGNSKQQNIIVESLVKESKDSKMQHRCFECGETFSKVSQLISHKSVHIATRLCNICGKVLPDQYALKQHKKIHSKKQCPWCKKMFHSLELYNTHIKLHCQNKKIIVEVIPDSEKTIKEDKSLGKLDHNSRSNPTVFPCKQCNKVFTKQQVLEHHALIHKFSCELCEKSYTRSHDLRKHKKKVHS